MKYYTESRHYIRRGYGYSYKEDEEVRCEKHEISELAYNIATEEIYADRTPLKNSDGSITYCIIQNSEEAEEVTFWVE